MPLLFTLVEDVIATLLLEWIVMKQLGLLDSATCNFNCRIVLLHILASDSCVFKGIDEKVTVGVEYIRWLGLRCVKVEQLKISYASVALELSSQFADSVQRLRRLHL